MTGPNTSPRLLKHIIRSYARLAENPRYILNSLLNNLKSSKAIKRKSSCFIQR